MESGKVKRPRAKVNRACYNCRRRKIKCTGKFPCTNCEAYQCECVYFPGYVPTKSNTTNVGGEYNLDVNGGTTSGNLESGMEKLQQQDDVTSSSTEKTCSHIETPCKDSICSSSDLNQCNEYGLTQGSEDDGFASMSPIELHGGSVGLYKDDIDSQKKLLNLQQSLKQLKSIPNRNEHIDEIINSINHEVVTLINEWEPEYDVKNYNKVFKEHGSEGLKSIETHLMKNKYTDQVALTSFAVWTDTNKAEGSSIPASSFLVNQPLVDDLFGLYSPMQALSLRGIGHLFQRCVTKAATSKEKVVQVKSNLYLLLRFFDICIDHFNQSCVSIANPLESYLQRKNLLLLTPNTTSSVSSRNSANSKDLVHVLINRLPQPFVQNVTSVGSAKLIDTMQDDFSMFSLLLKMFDDHINGFSSLMVKITANPGHMAMFAPKLSKADVQDFVWFCEEEELLLALCYSYYNSTLYHFSEFKSLEYFELLLSLLDKQLWLHEKYGFEKVLEVATSYAMGMGLSRWEFYVGLDELTAERRRECWWKFYCMEKRLTFLTGFLSSIHDSKMNCLLPRVFRDAGFSDHRSFVSKVHLVVDNSVFDNFSLDDLAFYGECAVIQVISDFYWDTLYDERYTSIKNSAKPPFVKYRLLDGVMKDTDSLKTKLEAIKIQTKRLHDIAYLRNGYVSGRISREDRLLAVKHVLLQGSLCFYVASAVSNLVSRLRVHPNQSNLRVREAEHREVLRGEYINMTKLLLSLDDDYSVACGFGLCYGLYAHVFLMMVSGSFSECHFEPTFDEMILVLRLVRRLRDISIYRENEDNDNVNNSKTCADFRRMCCFVSILTNSLIQNFMLLNDLTRDVFLKMLEDFAPDIRDLSLLILNPKSEVYRDLMEPVKESGVHLYIKNMLGKEKRFHNTNGYPKTAVQSLSPGNKDSQMKSFPFPQADMQVSQESPNVLSPPKKNMTSPTTIPVGGFLNDDISSIANDQAVNSSDFFLQSPSGFLEGVNKFNLGTLDEFVHKANLNDLYNTLWSDLYSDELGQSILALNDLSSQFNGRN